MTKEAAYEISKRVRQLISLKFPIELCVSTKESLLQAYRYHSASPTKIYIRPICTKGCNNIKSIKFRL